MAEVRKKKTELQEYNVDEVKKEKKKKEEKKKLEKSNDKKSKKDGLTEDKKSLWTKFRIFCHGVVSETKKVHWPTRGEMVKYSLATIVFIIFCSLFFYLIEVIFAFVQTLI